MATTISTQDIVDAKRDIEDIGKAVNEKVIVSPRYGEDFKSLPMIADEAQATIVEWESAIALITQEGGVPALAVSDASGVTQQDINDFGGAKWRSKAGGYTLGATVKLDNGDIVKSTIDGNTNNPNTDMSGWVKTNSASQIFDESGKTQQQINNLFLSRFASIEDFGASESATREVNTAAINTALTTFKRIYVPDGKSYPVNLNGIFLNTNNYLFGSGELVGPDPDAMMADVSGQMIRVDNCTGVVVTDVKIKNGYKGKGVWMTNSRNIEFNNFTIDGYSYGMWIGENDDGVGCYDIRINQPRILNTKYWGMYVRCLDVVVEANKTQKVTINDPYFYNANMAAFVCAEGHVKHVTLVNPVFERCNVDMHFESCSNYTVINPTSIDTGKKPDHLPANVEYPFVGWSLYQIFTQNSKVLGGNLDSTVWVGAGSDAKSWNHEYIGLTCKEFVFEGVGDIQDLSKDFFKGYTFSACTTTGPLIYQQTDAPLSYLRDFKIVDCSCLLGENGNSGVGGFIGLNPDRAVDWKVINNRFKNSAVRIRCEKSLAFKGNTFDGTDETQSRLDGVSGVLGSGSFLDFSGNTFQSAGGAVFSDSAILIKNWSVARTDNVVACNGTQRGYRFTDNFRIEFGAGLIYNDTVEKYADSGTSAFVFLYRA